MRPERYSAIEDALCDEQIGVNEPIETCVSLQVYKYTSITLAAESTASDHCLQGFVRWVGSILFEISVTFLFFSISLIRPKKPRSVYVLYLSQY